MPKIVMANISMLQMEEGLGVTNGALRFERIGNSLSAVENMVDRPRFHTVEPLRGSP